MTVNENSLENLYEPQIVERIKDGMIPLPCALHIYALEIDDPDSDGGPGCPECGCMLSTDYCWLCGVWTLHFGGQEFDDVVRDASGTASGDLMCARCAHEAEIDEQESDYGEWGDWEHS
jgi:hypothetical protein